jgi:hypothetical protein
MVVLVDHARSPMVHHYRPNSIKVRSLTLAFIIDAALRLGLKLGPDLVQQLIQALAGVDLGAAHHARRWVSVVHRGGLNAIDGGTRGCLLEICAVGAMAGCGRAGGVDAWMGARLTRLRSHSCQARRGKTRAREAGPAMVATDAG